MCSKVGRVQQGSEGVQQGLRRSEGVQLGLQGSEGVQLGSRGSEGVQQGSEVCSKVRRVCSKAGGCAVSWEGVQ